MNTYQALVLTLALLIIAVVLYSTTNYNENTDKFDSLDIANNQDGTIEVYSKETDRTYTYVYPPIGGNGDIQENRYSPTMLDEINIAISRHIEQSGRKELEILMIELRDKTISGISYNENNNETVIFRVSEEMQNNLKKDIQELANKYANQIIKKHGNQDE